MSQKPKARAKRTTRVICRTTSESLRLFDTDTVNTAAVTHVADNLTQSKSSFVVTNVVSSAGIDSPEDESHSEEISRITDLETPSYSEETYSKDVDDEVPSGFVVNAVDENPVPFDVLLAAKSEQSPESVSTNPFALENQTSVIELTTVQKTVTIKTATTSNETQEREDIFVAKCNRSIGRFQVVKVESIEPFYRGRWTCHDYLDNSQHAPAEGWVFHQDRFIKKSESQSIPISPNIPDCLPTQQIPLQSQTPLELHNEAPETVERTQEAPSYLHTNTTQHFPSFVGQAHQKFNRNLNSSARPTLRNDQSRITRSQYQGNLHQTGKEEDDVYLHNQYNLMSPDVFEQIPTKSALTKTQSSMSSSLHGSSITHTPPLSPNGDNLIQTINLNLPIPQVQGSFLQTPPETPLSIVLQYRNSKLKVPSEPVTPIEQAASATQNPAYYSLPTLYPITSRTYPPLLPQSDCAQNAFAHVQLTTNDRIYKLNRSASRATETVKEIKRQLSGDEADELIAHVETYLSGTEVLDGDKDYIIMVKRSSDGTTGDNVVICREVDSQMTKSRNDGISNENVRIGVSRTEIEASVEDTKDTFEVTINKGAIKKRIHTSCSEPEFKESTYKEKCIKTHTEENICQISNKEEKQSFKNSAQQHKHIPLYPLVQSSNMNGSNCRLNRLHKSKKFDNSIEEETAGNNNKLSDNQKGYNKSAQNLEKKGAILLSKFKLLAQKGESKKCENNDLDLSHKEECTLEENETNAVLEIVITESDSGLTPSSDEDEQKASMNESIFPEYFPVYNEWSSNDEDIKLNIEDGASAKKNICLICDISASLSFTVHVSHNSEEVESVTSCANSVIDHKIEQAMDMVKTHLMHSMRAEVESLRAKITELLERIHQLEIENDFLKSNATPEVLIALSNGAATVRPGDQGSPNNNFMTQSSIN